MPVTKRKPNATISVPKNILPHELIQLMIRPYIGDLGEGRMSDKYLNDLAAFYRITKDQALMLTRIVDGNSPLPVAAVVRNSFNEMCQRVGVNTDLDSATLTLELQRRFLWDYHEELVDGDRWNEFILPAIKNGRKRLEQALKKDEPRLSIGGLPEGVNANDCVEISPGNFATKNFSISNLMELIIGSSGIDRELGLINDELLDAVCKVFDIPEPQEKEHHIAAFVTGLVDGSWKLPVDAKYQPRLDLVCQKLGIDRDLPPPLLRFHIQRRFLQDIPPLLGYTEPGFKTLVALAVEREETRLGKEGAAIEKIVNPTQSIEGLGLTISQIEALGGAGIVTRGRVDMVKALRELAQRLKSKGE